LPGLRHLGGANQQKSISSSFAKGQIKLETRMSKERKYSLAFQKSLTVPTMEKSNAEGRWMMSCDPAVNLTTTLAPIM